MALDTCERGDREQAVSVALQMDCYSSRLDRGWISTSVYWSLAAFELYRCD